MKAFYFMLSFLIVAINSSECISQVKDKKEDRPTNLGIKGDAVHKRSGNPFLLDSGTDNAAAFSEFMKADILTKESELSGLVKHIPAGVYKSTGSLIANTSNLFLQGDNIRVTTIHPIYDNKNRETPAVLFGDGKKLLHGGGLSNLTLETEIFNNVRNVGLAIDYAEYMRFENVSIEGFNKMAIKAGIWESYFSNIIIFGCGAGLAAVNGIPNGGVIDFNGSISGKGDASNNTLFSKLTLSSCHGTHVNLVAPANTLENIHFVGFYDETDPSEAGAVDDLPKIYMKGASNIAFGDGFITINSTGTTHASTIVRVDDDARNGKLTFSDFHFNMNPSKGYIERQATTLRSVMQINGKNSRIFLNNVTISDPADMIGFNISGNPPLFEGNGTLRFSNLELNVRSKRTGGTRTIDNVFDVNLHVTGWVDWRPYDANGPLVEEFSSYYFENGKIIKKF